MDTLNSRLIILCGLVTGALAIHANQKVHKVDSHPKVRQLDMRLLRLETTTISRSVDTDLKFEDLLQMIDALNKTQFEHQCAAAIPEGAGEMYENVQVYGNVQVNTEAQDAISHVRRGFQDEKLARKLEIETMKHRMETLENELNMSVQTELQKVDEAIEADRNTTRIITTELDTVQRRVDYSVSLVNMINESLAISLQEIRKALEEMKQSNDDNGATLGRITQAVQEDRTKTDTIVQLLPCIVNGDPITKYKEWNGHWYITVKGNKTFADAAAICQTCGAHLVDIYSDDENKFVSSLIGTGEYWIGLTDAVHEGVWKWANTDQTASYLNWNEGEPNNVNNEDCGTLKNPVNGKTSGIVGYSWNDVYCDDYNHPFICKL